MLHLDAGVDFNKVKVLLRIDNELDGARIGVVGMLDQTHGRFADFASCFLTQRWRGTFLNQLLMPPLSGTISFPKMHNVPVLICEDLNLDVPRLLDKLFQVDTRIPKRRFGFVLSLLNRGLQDRFILGDSHAFSTAPRRGFDQDGVANFFGYLHRLIFVFDQAITSRDHRNLGGSCKVSRLILIAKKVHGFGRRTDKVDVAASANFIEVGVLCKESVAGMNRVNVSDFRSTDQLVDLQITVG